MGLSSIRSIFPFLLLSYSFHAIRMDVFIFWKLKLNTETGISGHGSRECVHTRKHF